MASVTDKIAKKSLASRESKVVDTPALGSGLDKQFETSTITLPADSAQSLRLLDKAQLDRQTKAVIGGVQQHEHNPRVARWRRKLKRVNSRSDGIRATSKIRCNTSSPQRTNKVC